MSESWRSTALAEEDDGVEVVVVVVGAGDVSMVKGCEYGDEQVAEEQGASGWESLFSPELWVVIESTGRHMGSVDGSFTLIGNVCDGTGFEAISGVCVEVHVEVEVDLGEVEVEEVDVEEVEVEKLEVEVDIGSVVCGKWISSPTSSKSGREACDACEDEITVDIGVLVDVEDTFVDAEDAGRGTICDLRM